MIQTNATFLVKEGVLMADQDQVISLANARVIVEPIDTPVRPDTTALEEKANAAFERMDRAASRLMKWFVIGVVLYLASEILHAFSSGAFPAVR